MRDIDRSSAEATLIPPGGIATKQIRSVESRLQVLDYRAFIARPGTSVTFHQTRNPCDCRVLRLPMFGKTPGSRLEGLVPARAWGFKSPLRHRRVGWRPPSRAQGLFI